MDRIPTIKYIPNNGNEGSLTNQCFWISIRDYFLKTTQGRNLSRNLSEYLGRQSATAEGIKARAGSPQRRHQEFDTDIEAHEDAVRRFARAMGVRVAISTLLKDGSLSPLARIYPGVTLEPFAGETIDRRPLIRILQTPRHFQLITDVDIRITLESGTVRRLKYKLTPINSLEVDEYFLVRVNVRGVQPIVRVRSMYGVKPLEAKAKKRLFPSGASASASGPSASQLDSSSEFVENERLIADLRKVIDKAKISRREADITIVNSQQFIDEFENRNKELEKIIRNSKSSKDEVAKARIKAKRSESDAEFARRLADSSVSSSGADESKTERMKEISNQLRDLHKPKEVFTKSIDNFKILEFPNAIIDSYIYSLMELYKKEFIIDKKKEGMLLEDEVNAIKQFIEAIRLIITAINTYSSSTDLDEDLTNALARNINILIKNEGLLAELIRLKKSLSGAFRY